MCDEMKATGYIFLGIIFMGLLTLSGSYLRHSQSLAHPQEVADTFMAFVAITSALWMAKRDVRRGEGNGVFVIGGIIIFVVGCRVWWMLFCE